LPTLILELAPNLTSNDLLIISDDSGLNLRSEFITKCEDALMGSVGQIIFSFEEFKSGRGNAVRRAIAHAREKFPNLELIVECDADGSHQVRDILAVKQSKILCDLLIGSRYLSNSEIIGWPTSRRIFSKLLNKILPRLLNLSISDITNGLRRYSIPAVDVILSNDPQNSGFIYLSEQALLISKSGLSIAELNTVFVNRRLGHSTVTLKEIVASLIGAFTLIRNAKKIG
jgi:dolichol-phosphate mannosyltransferase